jgi:hypothetical protein
LVAFIILLVAFTICVTIAIAVLGRGGVGLVVGSFSMLIVAVFTMVVWHWSTIAAFMFGALVGLVAGRSTYYTLSTAEQRRKITDLGDG